MKNKKLISGLVLIIGCSLVVGYFFIQRNELKTEGENVSKNSITEYTKSCIYEHEVPPVGSCLHLLLVSPQGEKIQVPDYVAIKIDGATRSSSGINSGLADEDIQNFHFPVNPFNKDEVFLSTAQEMNQRVDTANLFKELTNRIYKLNLKNWKLTEIYEEEAKGNSPVNNGHARTLVVWGIQDAKLIVFQDDLMNSPGPCYDYVAYASNQFLYLDIKNPSQGLKEYKFPQSVIDEARIKAEKSCARL